MTKGEGGASVAKGCGRAAHFSPCQAPGRDGFSAQEAGICAATLAPARHLRYAGDPARSLYLHVVRGAVEVEGQGEREELAAGDATAMARAAHC
ncbi:MAG: hypothetical protein ACOZCP_18540 [Pseudomonadota bacterium]